MKRPEIILLDEATSSVDTETEQLIQEAFRTLCKGRTTFIVAWVFHEAKSANLTNFVYSHRLSTIMKADRIMVVKDGEIIEHGSHEELIHSKGKYHDLWSKQILVKPVKEITKPDSRHSSRSRSPKKREAIVVNDLEPERSETELAEALRTTSHSEGPCNAPQRTERLNQGSTTETETALKLKPDAPEFVPRSSREITEETSSKAGSKHDAKERLKREKEERKEDRKAHHGALRKTAKKQGKKPGELDGKSSAA